MSMIRKIQIELLIEKITVFCDVYTEYKEKNYSSEEVVIDGTLCTSIEFISEDTARLLVRLGDIISTFVLVIDTHDHSKSFTAEQKHYYYALKCVNNIMKHKKIDYQPEDLVAVGYGDPYKDANDKAAIPFGILWSVLTPKIVKEIHFKE